MPRMLHGVPYRLNRETLDALPVSPEIDRIDRNKYAWPPAGGTGGTNNVDQIGHYSIIALRMIHENFEVAYAAWQNAREWLLHYIRGDGGHKDPAHTCLGGVRLFRLAAERMDRREDVRLADAVMLLYGPWRMRDLQRYDDPNWYEPRLIGRTLQNVSAYLSWRADTERADEVAEREARKDLHNVIRDLHPDNPKFSFLRGELGVEKRGGAATGWIDLGSHRALILHCDRYRPNIARSEPFFGIPWQLFSVLPYGIAHAWFHLDDAHKRLAVETILELRRFARVVAELERGNERFGDGGPRPILGYSSDNAGRLSDWRVIHANENPVKENEEAERFYRFFGFDNRVEVGQYQPECLPLRATPERWLEGVR